MAPAVYQTEVFGYWRGQDRRQFPSLGPLVGPRMCSPSILKIYTMSYSALRKPFIISFLKTHEQWAIYKCKNLSIILLLSIYLFLNFNIFQKCRYILILWSLKFFMFTISELVSVCWFFFLKWKSTNFLGMR